MGTDHKIYVINFFVENVNVGALHQYLQDSADVNGFWNYIPLVYCVKTRLSATDLSIKLRPFLHGNGIYGSSGFMIAQINPFNIDGELPPLAWSWFYDQPVSAAVELPRNNLADLLAPPAGRKMD